MPARIRAPGRCGANRRPIRRACCEFLTRSPPGPGHRLRPGAPARRRPTRCGRRRRLVHPVVGMRAEVVPQGLDERGGQPVPAQAVVVGQRGGERRGRDAGRRGLGHHPAPAVHAVLHGRDEVRRNQQAGQFRVLVVGLPDPVEEPGPDDAAAAPDRRHHAPVDAPAVLLAARADVVEALRVGDHLRGVQRAADVLHERVAVADLGRH